MRRLARSISLVDRRGLLTGLGAVGVYGWTDSADAAAGTRVLDATPLGAGLAYGEGVPGPAIRVRLGDELSVRLVNHLPDPTSLSWHGVRVMNAMDGVAGLTQSSVAPGGTFDIRFTPPDAGLYWYHPRVAGSVAAQTGKGLYGALIVEEREPPRVDDDVILMLAESGAAVLINGKTTPLALEHRPGSRLRLRLVNACVSRIMILGMTGATPSVIAIDGQPSELFQPPGGTVPIGPGSRFEFLADMPPDAGAVVTLALRDEAGQAGQMLMSVKVGGKPVPSHAPIAKLPDNPLLPTRIALEKAMRHDVVVAAAAQRWSINGIVGPAFGKPMFTVARGTPVVLALRNKSETAQQVHVHGHCWRLLHDLDDGWDPYWRDSVLLGPGRTKHVAFIADNPGKWALDSGDLARLDAGLSSWFEVK